MKKCYPAKLCLLLFALLLGIVNASMAQSCTGSLGDPVFLETFGDAGTTVKPTLGAPLPNGITNYTYYSPGTAGRPTGPYPGQYTISNTTRGYNNTYFVDRPDHTTGTGTGYVMVVDADANPGQFYQRTITGLCAGTTFEFSAWIMNINPQLTNVSNPSLRFDILDANNPNGAPIAQVSTGNVPYQSPGTWVRLAGIFQMPSTTSSVILRIISNTPSSQGNDLALDDIAFAACGPPITFTQAAGTVCAGGDTELSVSLPAGSYGSYFFQLQNRQVGTADWNNVGGIINNGANNTYTFPVSNAQAGMEYRVLAAGGTAEINNANCRVTSDPVTLNVVDFSMSINGPSSICYNTSTTLTAVVTPRNNSNVPTTSRTFIWESSPDGNTWTTISGQTGPALATDQLTANTYYRVTGIIVDCRGAGVSQVFTVNVIPQIIGALAPPNPICEEVDMASISYAITSGTANRYSITSTIPGFTPVTNAILGSSPLTVILPDNTAPGTYPLTFTFSNTTTGCVSDPVSTNLTIVPLPGAPNAGNDTTVCNVTSLALQGNTPVNGTGRWTEASGPSTVSFANSASPNTTVSNLVPGTYTFIWTIGNQVCSEESDQVQITVLAAPTTANAGPDQTQFNTGAFLMNANTPVNGTGSWSVISGNASVANTAAANTTVTIPANSSATLVWSVANGICPPSTDTVVINYISKADIQIVKTVQQNGPYLAGQDFDYHIVVTNVGPSNATNVRITDLLPSTFIATSVDVSTTGAARIVTNNSTLTNIDITADIPTQNASVVIVVKGDLSSSLNGDITNTAVAVSPDVPDDNGATSTITVPVVRRPYLSNVKSAPATAVAGDAIAFGVTVYNFSLGDAVNTVISDVVSQKVTNVSWTAVATGRATISAGATGTGNNVSVTASMPAGDTGKVYISIHGTVAADATDHITNEAIATLTEDVDPIPSNITTTLISSSPGLLIQKNHVGNIVLIAGKPVEYVIQVNNNGPSNAVGTVITDAIPAQILNPTWTTEAQGAATISSGASGSGNALSVTADIPAGNSNIVLIHIKGTVDPSFSGRLSNIGTATPAEPGVNPVSDDDNALVLKDVNFTAVKSGPATAVAGGQVAYVLDVTNTGPSNSTNTNIADQVPSSLYNVTWAATVADGTANIVSGATGSGNNVAVTANLNVGATVRILINSYVQPTTLNPIINSAVVTPSEVGIQPVNSNQVTTIIAAQANLAITKTGVDTIQAGNTITYTIFATNNGPSNARGVTIADAVPADIQNVTWVANATGNASVLTGASGSGNNITVTGDIAAGTLNAIRINVTGTVSASYNGNLVNNAIVTPSEPGSTGDTATKVTVVQRLPRLSVTKAAVDQVLAGDSLTYTIEVANLGVSNALGTVITDTIPAAILNPSWTTSVQGAAAVLTGGSGTGNIIRITANIPAGAANKITITVKGKTNPAVEASTTNTVYATPTEQVPPVSATKAVRIRKIPVVAISKSGPATLSAGEKIVYTLTVTNTSLSNADNLLITDDIPVPVLNPTWQAVATGAAQVTNNATGTGNTLSVAGNIPAGTGNSIVITIVGQVNPAFAGSFTNGASAFPAEPGTTPAGAQPVTTTVTQEPKIRIRKSGPAIANAGQTITYNLTVTNLGPSNSSNTEITDAIPAELTNVTWTATATAPAFITSGNSGTGNALRVLANVPADSGAVNIVVTGTIPGESTATSISNTAVATPSEPGIPPVNADTVITTINRKPGLLITKAAPSGAYAGSHIIYGFRAINIGPSDARGAMIRDTVPANVSVIRWGAVASGEATVLTGASGTGNIIDVNADIPVGGANGVIVLVEGRVNPDFEGTIDNTSWIFPAEAGADTARSIVQTTVTKQARLEISKAGPPTVAAGNPIQYTIEAVNSGPSNAKNVTITDVIPAGILNATWTATAVNGASITAGNTGTGNIALTADIPDTTGAKVVIVVNGTVDPNFTGTTLVNTAAVLNPAGILPSGDTATVSTAITREADLRIVKSGPSSGAVGQPIQYSLRIQNFGPTNAAGVSISDVLPATILNPTWTATAVGNISNLSPTTGSGNVNLTADMPADGSYITVTINGVVDPSMSNGATLTNTATVTAPAGIIDPITANNTSTVVASIDNDPVVRIAKSGPAVANIGDTIHYTVVVTNGGSGNITNALVVDNVPATVGVYNWTATGTGTATITGATSGATNSISTTGDIPVGNNSIVIDIYGVILNTAGTTITNTASVTAGSHKETSVVTAVNNSVDVRIVKNAPSTVVAGQAVNFILQVFNSGPRNADNIRIQDVIPPVVTKVTWTAIATGNASIMDSVRIDSSGNLIDLPAKIAAGSGNFITFRINGVVDGATTVGSIINTATALESVLVDANPANNGSVTNTTITKEYGVTVNKGGPQNAVAGNTIAYTLTIGNEGPSDAIGVNIADVIPPMITNVSWNVLVQGAASVTGPFSGTGNVNTTVDIPAGDQNLAVVAVAGFIDPAFNGDITNVVSAGNASIPAITDTLITHVRRLTILDINKSGPAKVTAGESMTYTIRATNNGPSNSAGIVISDTIDSRLTNLSWTAVASNGATINSGGSGTTPQILVNADIPAGGTADVVVTVTGTIAANATGTIRNTATATPPDDGVNTPVVSPEVVTLIESKPLLTIRKSGPAVADAGQQISYQLLVTNQGISDALNASITDVVPAALTGVTWSSQVVTKDATSIISGGTGAGNNVAITANIRAKGSILISITGKIDSTFAGTISNVGRVTPSEPTGTGDTSVVNTLVVLNPGLDIVKSGPSTIESGQPISYTITAVNSGPSNAQNALIRDMVPAAIQNVTWTAVAGGAASIIDGANGTGNTVAMHVNIPPGAGNNITITVNGSVNPAFRDTIRNMATITPAETGKTDSSQLVETVVTAVPVLTIAKVGPTRAIAGQQVFYTITVSNTSLSDAVNLNITDVVPSVLTNVLWLATYNGRASITGATNGSGNNISLNGNIPTGAGNNIVIAVQGTVDPSATGNIVNTATVTPSEPEATPKSSTVNSTIVVDQQLHITKTGPAAMTRGGQVTYVVTVNNTGLSPAINANISDSIPTVLTNVTWTATASRSATITAGATGSGNQVSITGTIPGTDSSSIQVVIRGTVRQDAAAGTVVNIARVHTAATTVESNAVFSIIGSRADLAITKTGTPQVYVNQLITYQLTVTNNGPSNANGAVVQDVLPTALLQPAISVVSTAGGAANVQVGITNGAAGAILGTFPAGAQAVLRITGIAQQPGTLNNTAVVNTPTGMPDADSSNNTSQTVVTRVLPKAQLDVNKSISPAGPYKIGDQVTYTLSATNNGEAGVNPVVVVDTLPPSSVLGNPVYTNPPRGTATLSNGVLTWNIGLLNAHETLNWSYNATVTGSGQIRNVAVITGPPDVTIPDTSVLIVDSDRYANLKVTKLFNTALPLKVGQTLEFTVNVTNNGPDTAHNVIMTDHLESMLGAPLSFNASKGAATFDQNAGNIIWAIPEMPSGTTETLTFTVKLINGGDVGNTATVTGDETDIDLSDNTFTIARVPVTGEDIFIPNVITPNGDGKNDTWFITGLSRYPGSSVYIYNRWGNQVYQSKDYDNKWNGNDLNEGTYFYILKLNAPTTGIREYKGWIELIR